MIEYIEREKLPQKKKRNSFLDADFNAGWNACLNNIKNIPAADVRPVVRGEWKEWWPGDCALIMTGEEMLWACSECESKYSEKQNYCPNCGADMREEGKWWLN